MIAQVKAELLKVRSTRTTIGLVLGMIVLILLIVLLTGLLTNARHSHAQGESAPACSASAASPASSRRSPACCS